MSMVGDLPVHFTSEKGGWGTKKGSVAELLDACRQVIRDGENIAAFPEGSSLSCLVARCSATHREARRPTQL
jgi:hypothetical protein